MHARTVVAPDVMNSRSTRNGKMKTNSGVERQLPLLKGTCGFFRNIINRDAFHCTNIKAHYRNPFVTIDT